MLDALLAGLFVGLSVAVLVGAPAMTVMETAIQRGRRVALAAGGGIASGDALWAAVAAGAGLALSRLLAPWATALQWIAVGVLAVFLALAVRELVHRDTPGVVVALAVSPLSAYSEFLVHTLRHPATVLCFMSLIVGAAPRYGAADAASFVGGVFLASLAWQWVLAFAGARRGRPFSGRARRVVLALDCVLLGLFIAYIALGFYRAA
jgi:threonine/homoserine/homoserine lactone efflux protein